MRKKSEPKKKSVPSERSAEESKAIDPVLNAIADLKAQIQGVHLESTENLNRRAQALTVLDAVDGILRALCNSVDETGGYYYYNFASDS